MGRAKQIRAAQEAVMAGKCPGQMCPELELKQVFDAITATFPEFPELVAASYNQPQNSADSALQTRSLGFGSTIFAVKPGDGSAREQAASCQKVLGGWANIANEYATKRYRSNLINWGMLPFLIEEGELPFKNLDYLYLPGIRKAVIEKSEVITAYAVTQEGLKAFELRLGELTDEERQIILKSCLINYNRV